MEIDEKEKLLFPSCWCKRFTTSESALEYIHKFGREETSNNAKYLGKKDVRYGPGERQLIDIYFKGDEIGTPIVTFIHGGYWQEFGKDQTAFWLKPYIEKGYRVIMIGYDLCPQVTLTKLIEEIKAALKFVIQYAAETETKTMSLIGHSAGAHLTISALDEFMIETPNFNILKSVFLVAGIYDTEVLIDSTVNANNMLSLDRSNFEKLSPFRFNFVHLGRLNLPIYVCSAEHESPLFIESSEKLAMKLTSYGAKAEYKHLKDVDHFDIMENFGKGDYELTKILLEYLSK